MVELEFPGNKKVRIDFEDNKVTEIHSYTRSLQFPDGSWTDFMPTHGITAPLEVIPKPFLKPWAAKMAVHATLKHAQDNPEVLMIIPQLFIDLADMENEAYNELTGKKKMTPYMFKKTYPWLSQLTMAFKNKSKEGTDAGTWLHKAIESFYNSGRKDTPIITEEVAPVWNSFSQFDNTFKPDIIPKEGTEFFVYSMMFGYSGQGDVRGRMNGKYVIGDWKTTNRNYSNPQGISVDNFYQLGGLSQAEWERTGVWPDDVFIANFDKKGDAPIVVFASDFGMSPADCAKAYISCHNTYHMNMVNELKFKRMY